MGGNEIDWNLVFLIMVSLLVSIPWLLGCAMVIYGIFGDPVCREVDCCFRRGNRGGGHGAVADDQLVAGDEAQGDQEEVAGPPNSPNYPNSPSTYQGFLPTALQQHCGEITTDDGQEAADDDDQTLTRQQKDKEPDASSAAACSQGDIGSTSKTKEEEAPSDDQVQEADDDDDQTLTRRQKGEEPDASSAACSQGDIVSASKAKEEEEEEEEEGHEEEDEEGHEEDEEEEEEEEGHEIGEENRGSGGVAEGN